MRITQEEENKEAYFWRSQGALSTASYCGVDTADKHQERRAPLKIPASVCQYEFILRANKIVEFWRSQEAPSNAYKDGVEKADKHERGTRTFEDSS